MALPPPFFLNKPRFCVFNQAICRKKKRSLNQSSPNLCRREQTIILKKGIGYLRSTTSAIAAIVVATVAATALTDESAPTKPAHNRLRHRVRPFYSLF